MDYEWELSYTRYTWQVEGETVSYIFGTYVGYDTGPPMDLNPTLTGKDSGSHKQSPSPSRSRVVMGSVTASPKRLR